jgi:hypothetical protein
MLHIDNVTEIVNTGRELSKLQGNCGRKLRRFLDRVLDPCIDEGCSMLHQNFAFMDRFTGKTFANVCEYAQYIHEQNMEVYFADIVTPVGLVADVTAGIVQNSYRINVDIKTASVADLKGVIGFIDTLAKNMRPFVKNPGEAVDLYVNREAYAAAARAEADRQANDRIARYFGMM